jgi:hypothetical protein
VSPWASSDNGRVLSAFHFMTQRGLDAKALLRVGLVYEIWYDRRRYDMPREWDTRVLDMVLGDLAIGQCTLSYQESRSWSRRSKMRESIGRYLRTQLLPILAPLLQSASANRHQHGVGGKAF